MKQLHNAANSLPQIICWTSLFVALCSSISIREVSNRIYNTRLPDHFLFQYIQITRYSPPPYHTTPLWPQDRCFDSEWPSSILLLFPQRVSVRIITPNPLVWPHDAAVYAAVSIHSSNIFVSSSIILRAFAIGLSTCQSVKNQLAKQ